LRSARQQLRTGSLQHRGRRKAAELALDHAGERDCRVVIQVAADDLDPDW
jgi:hypothetical protein